MKQIASIYSGHSFAANTYSLRKQIQLQRTMPMSADAFIQIEGISGESLDEKHKGWIELTHYRFGVRQPTSATASSAGGAGSARADLMELSITKRLDVSSPKLFEASCSGTHLKKMTISVNRAGGDKMRYFEINLEEVIVSEFINAGGDGEPVEEIRLNYGRINTRYIRQSREDGEASGIVAGGWDRIAHRPHS